MGLKHSVGGEYEWWSILVDSMGGEDTGNVNRVTPPFSDLIGVKRVSL